MLLDATKILHLPVTRDTANMGRLLWPVGPVLQNLTRLDRFILTFGENAGGYWEHWSLSQLSQVHHRTHIHSHREAISSQTKGPLLEPREGAGPAMDQRGRHGKWKIFFTPFDRGSKANLSLYLFAFFFCLHLFNCSVSFLYKSQLPYS